MPNFNLSLFRTEGDHTIETSAVLDLNVYPNGSTKTPGTASGNLTYNGKSRGVNGSAYTLSNTSLDFVDLASGGGESLHIDFIWGKIGTSNRGATGSMVIDNVSWYIRSNFPNS